MLFLVLIGTLACTTGDLHVPDWTLGVSAGAEPGTGGAGDDGGSGGSGDDGGSSDDGGSGTGDGGGTGSDDGGDEGTATIVDELYDGDVVPCQTGDESTRVPITVENGTDVVPIDIVASLDDCSRVTIGTAQPMGSWSTEYARVGDAYIITYVDPEDGETIDHMYIIVGDDDPTVVVD